ncbi:leucine-rich repeat domain-containing protein [Leptospira ainazelensis]|uniref:leucine-rich repeat domain-containing protein n=1 Tax=Leptospira ainazelensis TaxID=2810034 RepID=UPI0019645E8D|nr:leucine-rich repeat domain-containing protein [Leptospira ainazelensis]
MKFRIRPIHFQKTTNFLLTFLCFFSELQADAGVYTNLTSASKNPSDVRVLDLSHQSLTALPKEIRLLQNLQELDLSNHRLENFPKEILELQNLRKLDIK